MKTIILGALEYGLSFGVDRAVRDLMASGRLSVAGCLVGTDLWPREFKPLRDLLQQLGPRARAGVTLALSGDHVTPVSERMRATYGGTMPSRARLERFAMMRMLPDELLEEEILAQIGAYQTRMQQEPAFLAMREGLLDRSEIIRILLRALAKVDWQQKPVLLGPSVTGRNETRLKRMAKKAGYPVFSWGPPVPEVSETEQLLSQLRHHFDPLAEETFVATLAGEADDRIRRLEPPAKVAVRQCQRDALLSDRFFQILDEREVFLT